MEIDAARLEELFVSLLDLEPASRAATLDQLHQQEPLLAQRLETMLRGFEGFDQGLMEQLEPVAIEKLVLERTHTAPSHDKPEMPTPQTIGCYRIIQAIGEGGMGRVFLAEQEEPKRKVALKLIRSDLGSSKTLQRFRSEYRAHALMKHQHIAGFYEVGTTDEGQTFFTMEYLDGLPLIDYCRKHQLNGAERLQLFRQVCRGVEHAHRWAILHRDLKPNNIIVVTTDDGPQAKIIDFGLAKDLSTNESTMELTHQGQIIGTPLYMAPEQLTGQPIDTRGDIYSLGVILYELLARRHPLDRHHLEELSLQELLRICQEEEPPRPSRRLLEAAASQEIDKQELHYVRGDLDSITLKAMAKSIEARYASLAELIADLDRFQNHRPVRAKPPRLIDRLSKFLRRNRILVTASGLGLTAILIGLTMASVSAWRLVRANQETERALARNKVTMAFLEDTFSSPDPRAQGPRALVVDLLASAGDRLQQLETDSPLVGPLRTTWGRTYLGLGMYDRAEQELRQALTARRQLLGEAHQETSQTRYYLAWTCLRRDDLAEATRIIDTAIRFQQLDPGPHHPDLLRSQACKAMILRAGNHYKAAQALFQEVLAEQQQVLGPHHEDTVQSMVGLGNTHFGQQAYAAAEGYYREALALQEDQPGPNAPETLATRYQLGHTLYQARQYAEAEQLIEETAKQRTSVLGAGHPLTLQTLKLLATCYYRQKKYTQAEAVLNELLDDGRQPGQDLATDELLRAKHQLAMVYARTHRPQQAIDTLHALVNAAEDHNKGADLLILRAQHNLGHLLGELGEPKAATESYERALDGRIQVLGIEHRDTLKTWFDLAELYAKQGEDSDGYFLRQAWLTANRVQPDDPATMTYGKAYARWLAENGRDREAQELQHELCDREARDEGLEAIRKPF